MLHNLFTFRKKPRTNSSFLAAQTNFIKPIFLTDVLVPDIRTPKKNLHIILWSNNYMTLIYINH